MEKVRVAVWVSIVLLAACADPSRTGLAGRLRSGANVCDSLPVLAHVVGQRYDIMLYEGPRDVFYLVKGVDGSLIVACASADALWREHRDVYETVVAVVHQLETPQIGYVP